MIRTLLREAVLADIPAVLAFWKLSAEDTNRMDSAPALRLLLERDPGALMLAVENDQILGSLIAGWDGWRCHLYRFAVLPDRRRQDIGGSLLAAAEERFAEFGGHRADAMVLADNDSAHLAWAASGYVPEPQWTRWVKPLP